MADGMAAGHIAARAAIKAVRPELPVGLSIAVVDDVVIGDDPSVRDRKRAEVYDRWLVLAQDDDFVGVQNYERVCFDGTGELPPAAGVPLNQMGTAIEPGSLGGAVRYAYERAGVPVFVTEHGMSHGDDSYRAAFIVPVTGRAARCDGRGGAGAGVLPLDLPRQLPLDLRLREPARPFAVDRETFVRTPKPSAGVYSAVARAHGFPAAQGGSSLG